MAIAILNSQDYNAWDQYVRDHTFPENLLQTSQWPGDFFIVTQKDDAGQIMSGARVDVRDLWLGKRMWWIRREVQSSKFKVQNCEINNDIWMYLIARAERENVVFIRCQSKQSNHPAIQPFNHPKFLYHLADPELTLAVDLRLSEDELLRAMHEKTRYNIRLAVKHGVIVNPGTLDELFVLYEATNARKGLRGYPRTYFAKLINITSPLSAHILTARLIKPPYPLLLEEGTEGAVSLTPGEKSTPIASNFLIGFGTTCFYLFGGTDDRERRLMAPHLLHWESIRWAKRQGYQWYDMGGISDIKSSWHGLTRFKRSFVSPHTGREINHGKTYDLVIQPRWYSLFALTKRMIRLRKIT